MTVYEQAWESLLSYVNENRRVCFSKDWGGLSLTMEFNDGHTHVGGNYEEMDMETLVTQINNQLTGGPGLSKC